MKFGEYVTGDVVKVSEKFGIDWSIFVWFGHFTEHVVYGELGFWRYGHFGLWNPPEGARNLQGYSRSTEEHLQPHGFTGIHKNLNWINKGWAWKDRSSTEFKRQRKGKGRS
jgi:hypothetical protein